MKLFFKLRIFFVDFVFSGMEILFLYCIRIDKFKNINDNL